MRRNRYMGQSGRSAVWMLAGVLILAAATGYVGTRYFIAPYVLKCEIPDRKASVSQDGVIFGEQEIQNVSGSAIQSEKANADSQQEQSAPKTDENSKSGDSDTQGNQADSAAEQPVQSTAVTAPAGKYAVQFASFSAEEAAKTEVAALASQNITASVLSRDGAFKVIGAPFDTKEQAKAEVERLRAMFPDVFVTGI